MDIFYSTCMISSSKWREKILLVALRCNCGIAQTYPLLPLRAPKSASHRSQCIQFGCRTYGLGDTGRSFKIAMYEKRFSAFFPQSHKLTWKLMRLGTVNSTVLILKSIRWFDSKLGQASFFLG